MEEQYIPYGQDQVDVQEMNKLLADNVEPYLSSKRWSPEQKNKWRQAYGDLMSRGILGISTDGGRYSIEHNGVPFVDTEGYYGDVANFITTNLSSIAKKKEEEKKVELPKYNLDQDFTSYFMNQYYGGTGESNFENFRNTWSNLDKADKYGIRGTDVRRSRLKEALQNYITYLDENKDKYNYDNGVFKNLDDLKGRLNAAIHAMDTPEQQDDIDTLNALGIRPDFLDTGANRTVTLTDGTQMTASQYRDQDLKQQEQAKLAADKQARANQFKKVRFISAKNFNGTPPTGQNVLEKLNGYYSLGNLNGQQQSELIGAFKFAERNNALKPLGKEELAAFGSFRGADRLRKIDGLNGFYWDSAGQRIVQPFMNNTDGVQSFQDLVNQNDPKLQTQKAQQEYLNSTEGGFTPAEQREVAALLFDLGAAVDPEGFSSAGLSQIAAGIRDYNRASDPEGWTWGDTGWATLDHGLGLLSTIPVVGGLLKGSWAASKLGNYIPKMEKWIRLAGRAGSTYAMTANASGALNALNKIKNGEDLSLKDYQDLAYFFIGGLGHHQLNKTNRTARTAMKARGVETSNSILNKAGITRTKAKAPTTKTTPTLKVKKTGEDGKVETKEIPIDAEKQKVLKGTKPEELDAKAKDLGIEIPEGYKIETTTTSWRKGKINEYKAKVGYGNKEIFGTQTKQNQNSTLKSNEEFEQYLSEHNNTWLKKIINGTNKDIRRYDKYLGNNIYDNDSDKSKSISSASGASTETSKSIETSKSKSVEISKQSKERIKKYNESVEKRIKGLDEGKFSKNKLKSGNLDIAGYKLQVVEQSDGTFNLIYKGNIQGNFQKHEQKKLQEAIREIIRNRTVKIDPNTKIKSIGAKEIGKVLQDLKARGWLKQGGKIDNPSVDDIINNYFKNKQI